MIASFFSDGLPSWIIIIGFVLEVYAVVQCLKSHFIQPSDKIAWLLALLLLPVIGSILWFIMDQETEEQR